MGGHRVPPASLASQTEMAPQNTWLCDFMFAQRYFVHTSHEYLAIYLDFFVNQF